MDNPIELTDGRLVCRAHRQVVCAKCTVDYSFMDDISDEENKEESDGDELLTEEEMKAFRQRMIAKKGCACLLPMPGTGCTNCDPELKDKKQDAKVGNGTGSAATKAGQKQKK